MALEGVYILHRKSYSLPPPLSKTYFFSLGGKFFKSFNFILPSISPNVAEYFSLLDLWEPSSPFLVKYFIIGFNTLLYFFQLLFGHYLYTLYIFPILLFTNCYLIIIYFCYPSPLSLMNPFVGHKIIFSNSFFLRLFIGFLVYYLYSVICRPSDHTVGRPRAKFEPGRLRGRDITPRPPHLLKLQKKIFIFSFHFYFLFIF